MSKLDFVSKKRIGFPFAITNHLGDAFFRGMAVCRISDINRTKSHLVGTLQLASAQNLRKITISKAQSVFAAPERARLELEP